MDVNDERTCTPIHLINANTFILSGKCVRSKYFSSISFRLEILFFPFCFFYYYYFGRWCRSLTIFWYERVFAPHRHCTYLYVWIFSKYLVDVTEAHEYMYSMKFIRKEFTDHVLFINGRIARCPLFGFKCFSYAFDGARVCRIHRIGYVFVLCSVVLRTATSTHKFIISNTKIHGDNKWLCGTVNGVRYLVSFARLLQMCARLYFIIWFIVRNESV